GLLDGRDKRFLVERLQRARIDDLDGDSFLLRLLGGREGLVDESSGRDHRHVLAFAVHARLADRDRLDLLRNVALDAVQRPVLEEDDGVVVVDRAPQQSAHVLWRRWEDNLLY